MTEDIQWIDGPNHQGSAAGGTDLINSEHISLLLNDIEVDEDEDFTQLHEDGSSISPFPCNATTTGYVITQHNDLGLIPEVRRNIRVTSTTSSAKWIFAPMLNGWKELLHFRTVQHNYELIRIFHKCLNAFFGKDHVPVEILAVFEASSSPRLTTSRDDTEPGDGSEESYADLISLLSKSFILESQVTNQLRMLLLASLNFLNDIVDVTTKIQEQMHLIGCLLLGTPEHDLCQYTSVKMIDLMKKLQVISVILRTKVPNQLKHDVAISAIKIRCDPWINNSQSIKQLLSSDVLFSVAPQIEGLYVTSYESVLRMVCSVGYFLALPELTEAQHLSLMKTAIDLTISIQDIRESVRSSIIKYEISVEVAVKELQSSIEPIPPSFSRESKLKRHCDEIIKWSESFSEHASTLRLNAIQLESLSEKDRGTQPHQDLISEIKRQEALSYDYLTQLTHLLNVQSALIGVFATKQDHHQCIVPSDVTSAVVNHNEAKTNISGGRSEEDDVSQPVEYFDAGTMDGQGIDMNQAEDEVFIGMPNDNIADCTFPSDPEGNSDKKLVTVIYGGVVDQLRTVLQPVQSQMKVREKEALAKKYGDIQDAGIQETDDEEGEDYKENANGAQAIKESYGDADEESVKCSSENINVNNSVKKKEISDSEDDSDFDTGVAKIKCRKNQYNHCDREEPTVAFFPHSDFMKELKQKLNTGPNPHFHLQKDEDEELGDELDSESDSESY